MAPLMTEDHWLNPIWAARVLTGGSTVLVALAFAVFHAGAPHSICLGGALGLLISLSVYSREIKSLVLKDRAQPSDVEPHSICQRVSRERDFMPVPSYFAPQQKRKSLHEITGGLSADEVYTAIENGSRFVAFQYKVSALLFTTRRYSRAYFLKPNESAVWKSLPYTLLTLLMGWWGLHGLFLTPPTLLTNLRGGTDLTDRVRASLQTRFVEEGTGQAPSTRPASSTIRD